mmetsp:Transcript_21362/g.66218  ORF Transcript_21362/g.66218 Transcript_21362/m.66218 type:complete len:277 (+) Transcript_21362:448-1278(+)
MFRKLMAPSSMRSASISRPLQLTCSALEPASMAPSSSSAASLIASASRRLHCPLPRPPAAYEGASASSCASAPSSPPSPGASTSSSDISTSSGASSRATNSHRYVSLQISCIVGASTPQRLPTSPGVPPSSKSLARLSTRLRSCLLSVARRRASSCSLFASPAVRSVSHRVRRSASILRFSVSFHRISISSFSARIAALAAFSPTASSLSTIAASGPGSAPSALLKPAKPRIPATLGLTGSGSTRCGSTRRGARGRLDAGALAGGCDAPASSRGRF